MIWNIRSILALTFVKMKYISGYSFQKRLKEKMYIKMNYGKQRVFNKFFKNNVVKVVYEIKYYYHWLVVLLIVGSIKSLRFSEQHKTQY